MAKKISKENAEKLFKEYSTFIFRIALFLAKSSALADDITQETFLQVFRKYHMYDATKPIQPWIYKITLNTARNTLRKQKWLKFTDEIPETHSPDFVDGTILRNEEERELWREINKLNIKSREIIVLHFYSGMKLNEISTALEIPLGTCKSRLNFALNTLRKQLSQNGFSIISRGGDVYGTI